MNEQLCLCGWRVACTRRKLGAILVQTRTATMPVSSLHSNQYGSLSGAVSHTVVFAIGSWLILTARFQASVGYRGHPKVNKLVLKTWRVCVVKLYIQLFISGLPEQLYGLRNQNSFAKTCSSLTYITLLTYIKTNRWFTIYSVHISPI